MIKARSILGVAFLGTALLINAGCLVGASNSVKLEGNYVAESTLKQIEVGKTSQAWVQATVGEPTDRKLIEPGHEVWRYSYTETKDSSGYVFFIFGGSDKKTMDGRVFIEMNDGIVTNMWRG